MSKRYGVGYVGSKNKIAEKIIADLPAGENLYDIFAGGCAITHCASESGKWQHIHTNDINGGILQVFKKSLNGEIKPYLTRWVPREEFFSTADPVIITVWSYGNNNKNYLYSKEKEPIAEKMFKAVSGEDYDGFNALVGYDTKPLLLQHHDNITKRRLLAYKIFAKSCIDKDEDYGLKSVRKYIEKHKDDPKYQFKAPNADKCMALQYLERLQSLESLEMLQSLERLQSLESLEMYPQADITYTTLDFSELEIKPNSIIYCDPPYITENEQFYDKFFNQPKFFKWAQNKANEGHQVFVSAYNIEQPNFHKVNEYTISSCYNKQNARKKEVLYKVEPENN